MQADRMADPYEATVVPFEMEDSSIKAWSAAQEGSVRRMVA